MLNVFVICVCFKIYFLIDHHCKTPRIMQKLLKFLQGNECYWTLFSFAYKCQLDYEFVFLPNLQTCKLNINDHYNFFDDFLYMIEQEFQIIQIWKAKILETTLVAIVRLIYSLFALPAVCQSIVSLTINLKQNSLLNWLTDGGRSEGPGHQTKWW